MVSYSPKTRKPARPLHVRIGAWLLLLVFVAMMAGRFSLNRFGASLPSTDLRAVFLYVAVAGVLVWVSGAHRVISKPVKVAGAGLFAAWAGWLMLSAAWSPPGARLGEKLADIGFLAAFTLLAWALMSRLPAEVTAKIWKWTLVAALIYFVLAMAEGPGAQGRYAAPGGGPNVFVRVMILGAIAALFYASEKRKTWPLIPVPLFAIGAALSGSRGGLLSAGVVLFFFSVPIARRLGAVKVSVILVLAAGAIVALSLMDGGALVEFVQQRYIQQTLVEGYSSGRDTITEDALSLYGGSPIIGTGLDGYWALQSTAEAFEYPHNLFVATLAESGTVGLLFIGGALVVFLVATKGLLRLPATVLYAMVAGVYLTIASLFSGDYYDTRLMWFFFGFAVIEAARSKAAPTVASAGAARR